MDAKQMIERRLESEMLVATEWRDSEDGPEAVIGRYKVIEELVEDEPPFLNDRGVLSALQVGAEKHGNQRVLFVFTTDGTTGGDEINDLSVLEPI